jgi:chemotaxis protein CheD
MFEQSKSPVPADYFLKPGYIFLPNRPTVISTVLGSCVGVCLWDRKRRVGGVNHFQLPYHDRKENATARYGDVSTVTLIRMMMAEGSKIKHLEAQIFGGADNPELKTRSVGMDVGMENIQVARKILGRYKIKIVSEDVGGEKGRKIVFNTGSYEIAVLKVESIRKGDWYPYISDR